MAGGPRIRGATSGSDSSPRGSSTERTSVSSGTRCSRLVASCSATASTSTSTSKRCERRRRGARPENCSSCVWIHEPRHRDLVVVNRSVVVGAFMLALVGTRARADAPKRQIPNYDGRGSEPTTAGDAALWIPRALLLPPYIVSEYVIRRPLGALIAGAERAGVPQELYDLFTFGPDHKAGIVPVAFVEFGFRPSVGVYSFWDDAFVDGHDLRLTAATWGSDWLAFRALDRVHFSQDRYDVAVLEISGIRR